MSAQANGLGNATKHKTKPQRGGHNMDFNSNSIETADGQWFPNECTPRSIIIHRAAPLGLGTAHSSLPFSAG